MSYFINVDGMDFTGKSTIVDHIEQWMLRYDIKHIITREPGGTELGENLRDILLHRDMYICPDAELLMFYTCRAQMLRSTTQKEIKLALRVTKQNDNDLNSFIELGLNQPIHNNPIKIKSGLKSTKISFIREIYNNKKPSLNLALGLNKKLKNNIQINTNLNYEINTNKEQHLNYSININF